MIRRIIFLLIFSVGICQHLKHDDSILKKGIKTATKYSQKILEKEFGDFEEEPKIIRQVIEYNLLGNPVKYNSYSSDGSPREEVITKYDKNKNIIEESGRDAGREFKETYRYDSQQNKIEKSAFDENGLLKRKDVYKYDNKGNQIEHMIYNGDESLRGRYKDKYDDDGNRIHALLFLQMLIS